MPDKTAASFRADGFFVTGDLGTLAADGRLTLSGRGTDLIISGGLNIYPKEIELLLDEVAGVAESAVIGVPHPDLGDGVIAVVVAEPGFDTASIRVALDGRLARFKHPNVAVVDDLPRNAMGKVEKAVLRARYAEQFTAVDESRVTADAMTERKPPELPWGPGSTGRFARPWSVATSTICPARASPSRA